jgi:hypothetical protein
MTITNREPVKITKCPPGVAQGANSLANWATERRTGSLAYRRSKRGAKAKKTLPMWPEIELARIGANSKGHRVINQRSQGRDL